MRVVLRHEWLQKHASPRSARGDFHWYPEAGDGERRAALAARAGSGGDALWRIEPGRVTWAASFAEVAPADRRSYVGLAVTVAEGEGPAAALLAALEPLPAAPWRDQPTTRTVEVEPPPRLLATLETWLPDGVAGRARAGALIAPGGAAGGSPGPLFHYLGLAWALPPAIAARDPELGRRAWRAATGLAARGQRSLEATFDELAELSRSWNTAPELAALLARTGTVRADELAACDARAPAPLTVAADAGRLWSRVVHHWGRGLLAGDGLEQRLGALLARRVLADHLFHLDTPDQAALPWRYLRRLRRETILPRAAAARLATVVAASLPELEVPRALRDGGSATDGPEVLHA